MSHTILTYIYWTDTLTSLDGDMMRENLIKHTPEFSFESFVRFFLAEVGEMERENAILYHHVSAFRLFFPRISLVFLLR